MKISFKFSEPDGRLFPVLTKGAAWAVRYSHHPPLCGGHDQSGPVSVCVDPGVPTGQSPPSLRVQVSKPRPGLVRHWLRIMEKVFFFYYSLYQIDDMNWKEIEGRGDVIINLYSVYQMYGLHLYALLFYSDDSLGYEYPFTLKVVKKDGFSCAWCPWYRYILLAVF